VNNSKRKSIKDFFLEFYLVPEETYDENESVFFKLILNTVKDVESMGVKPDPSIDEALEGVFKQKPNMANTQAFFSHPCIASVWTSRWGGQAEAYASSQAFKDVIAASTLREKKAFVRQLIRMKIDFRPYLIPV